MANMEPSGGRLSKLARLTLATLRRSYGLHAAAWDAMTEPIVRILNEPDSDMQDRLTEVWQKHMQSQIEVILVTGALVASLIAGSLSWSTFADPAQGGLVRVAQAIWYCGLLTAMTAIATGSQLAIALNRLVTYSDGLLRIRTLLRTGSSAGDASTPATRSSISKTQMYMWQLPAMLLNGSIYLYVLGLCLVVSQSARDLLARSLRGEAIQLVVVFALGLVFAISNYWICYSGLYASIREAGRHCDRS